MIFTPFRLLSLLFCSLLTVVILQLKLGEQLIAFDAPESLTTTYGLVVAYALKVLSNSQNGYYQATMLVLFVAAAIYCLLQIIGIMMDIRRLRRVTTSKQRNFHLTGRIAAFLFSRPFERYTHAVSSGKLWWEYYAQYGHQELTGPVRILTQVFPLLGFLGTIAGIASSLNYLPTGDENSGDIGALTQSLYTAFDTTFIGLVASFALLVTTFYLDSAWRRLADLARRLPD